MGARRARVAKQRRREAAARREEDRPAEATEHLRGGLRPSPRSLYQRFVAASRPFCCVRLMGRRAHLLGIGLDDLHLEHHGRRRPHQHHGLGLLRLLALTVEHVEVGLLATRQICSTIKLCH
jgi:hypothetical protein